MIESVTDARSFTAGLIRAALAAPLGTEREPRTLGPFAVIAHSLPLHVEPGALPPDFDVRAHPHIGLAAITYLLDGHVTHRDSLGSRDEIGPGGMSYMIAGKGVVHSERFERVRLLGGRIQLLQILLALPDGAEEAEPAFHSVEASRVPRTAEHGAAIHWLAGGPTPEADPVRFPGPMFLCDVHLEPGARYRPPEGLQERAVYVLSGAIEAGSARAGAQQVAVLAPGAALAAGTEGARILAFGGEPVGPRYMWWNFIHSSLERLEAAKAEWRAGKTALPPGDTESFIPAPPDDGRPLLRLNGVR
jgi:redox-sensitive bicupin YhaK (pirin superfamily)